MFQENSGGMNVSVFQFFFQATFGIAAGLAVAVLPAIYLYIRYVCPAKRGNRG